MELKTISVDSRSIEIEYARACYCEECNDEVSRTLDEIAEVGGPVCPECGSNFLMTSVTVILER